MSISSKRNICNCYIVIFLLYMLQGLLYESGGVISQSLLMVEMIVGLVVMCKVLALRKYPPFFKGLNVLLLMFTVYGVVLLLSGQQLYIKEGGMVDVRNINYLKEIYIAILPIYTFYYFTLKGYLDETMLRKWVFVFFAVAIVLYFKYQALSIEKLNLDNDADVTNNGGYLFVALFPALMMLKGRSMLQYAGLIVINVFVFLSVKRGAIIVDVVLTLAFLWFNLKNVKGNIKLLVAIIIVVLLISAYFFIVYLMENNELFNQRIQSTLEGNSSNRDIIYSTLWEAFISTDNPFYFFFGRGAFATLNVGINFAHNDWLEILTNQGLVGVILFARFFYLFYKNSVYYTRNAVVKEILILAFMIMLLRTFFSMSYTSIPICLSSVMGYALAQTNVPTRKVRAIGRR